MIHDLLPIALTCLFEKALSSSDFNMLPVILLIAVILLCRDTGPTCKR